MIFYHWQFKLWCNGVESRVNVKTCNFVSLFIIKVRSKINVTWCVFLYFRVHFNLNLTYLASLKSQDGACYCHEKFEFKEKLTKQIKEDEHF